MSSRPQVPVAANGLTDPVLQKTLEGLRTAGLPKVVLAVYGSVDPQKLEAALDAAPGVWALEVDVSEDVGAVAAAASVVIVRRASTEAALAAYALGDAVAMEVSHAATVVDVAASSPEEDRGKLVFHEATACGAAALVSFAACRKQAPLFVSAWSLATDDCDDEHAPDYGQCDRLDDRLASPAAR